MDEILRESKVRATKEALGMYQVLKHHNISIIHSTSYLESGN